MIEDALAFWEAIRPKVRQEISSMTANSLRWERYDVEVPPDGTHIGVKKPYAQSYISIPYAPTVKDAVQGQTVIVQWRGTLSTALAIAYGDGLSSTEYILPAAKENALGGIMAGVKTAADSIQAKIGSDNMLYVQGTVYKRLWKNAKPGQQFAPQTLTLPEYAAEQDFWIIMAKYYNTEAYSYQTPAITIERKLNNKANIIAADNGDVSSLYVATRYMEIVGDRKLKFTSGVVTAGGSTSTDNLYCIPLEIWGMKI